MTEEAARGGVDAEGLVAEINAVEIEFEDFVFSQPPLDARREHHFTELAIDRLLGREEEVARQLLRDGRRALPGFAGAQIGEHGAQDRHAVDALVFVEAAVFDGDEGLRHVGRQIVQVHPLPIVRSAHAKHLTASVEEHGRLLTVERPECVSVGDLRQTPIDPEPKRHDDKQNHARNGAADTPPRPGAAVQKFGDVLLGGGCAQLGPIDTAWVWLLIVAQGGLRKFVSNRGNAEFRPEEIRRLRGCVSNTISPSAP